VRIKIHAKTISNSICIISVQMTFMSKYGVTKKEPLVMIKYKYSGAAIF
jgi:hypothetical protein